MRAVAKRPLPRRALLLVTALCLLNISCSTSMSWAPDWRQSLSYQSSLEADQCIADFRRFDQAVRRAGVREAEAARINGFPYLRINRFLASFRHADLSQDQFNDWVHLMRRLDRDARFVETQNMGDAPVSLDRLDLCAETLLKADQAQSGFEMSLRRAAFAPDHYSFWKRLAGAYPLTNIAAAVGYADWRQETLDAFAIFSNENSALGPVYQPKMDGQSATSGAEIFLAASRDSLSIPRLSPAQQNDLLSAFAPMIRVGSEREEDRIGHPKWMQGETSERIEIDVTRPTLFGRIAYAYWNGKPTLQLVYTMWFSERPKTGTFDILGGSLDGLIWRVTLDHQGRPIVYDSIHPCGCYHLFFPASDIERQSLPEDSDLRETILVPERAPVLTQGERIMLTLEPGTHYLVSVDAALSNQQTGEVAPYVIHSGDQVPDQELRLLPLPGGLSTRSIYGEDGVIRQSERLERWILWPMGIESAGAMRQWGTHATAFVGMRHFDDPYLIEQSFE